MSVQADKTKCRHHEADGMHAHFLKLLELTNKRQDLLHPHLGWHALLKPT